MSTAANSEPLATRASTQHRSQLDALYESSIRSLPLIARERFAIFMLWANRMC